MAAQAKSDPTAQTSLSPVVEFRRYVLQPGAETAFADLFERAFIEPMEAEGMRVIGQFRNAERRDRFIWLRGYDDMEHRLRALTAFYAGGAAWKEHGPAANAMIAEFHDVHLLRPAWPGSGFSTDLPSHPPLGSRATQAVVIAITEKLDAPADEQLITLRRAEGDPFASFDGELLASFMTEPSANNFPRHPVREGEHVFARFARFNDRAVYDAWRVDRANEGDARTELLLLSPTPRSRVR